METTSRHDVRSPSVCTIIHADKYDYEEQLEHNTTCKLLELHGTFSFTASLDHYSFISFLMKGKWSRDLLNIIPTPSIILIILYHVYVGSDYAVYAHHA